MTLLETWEYFTICLCIRIRSTSLKVNTFSRSRGVDLIRFPLYFPLKQLFFDTLKKTFGRLGFGLYYQFLDLANYMLGREDDVGQKKEGPPDFFLWIVLAPNEYEMNKRGQYLFKK